MLTVPIVGGSTGAENVEPVCVGSRELLDLRFSAADGVLVGFKDAEILSGGWGISWVKRCKRLISLSVCDAINSIRSVIAWNLNCCLCSCSDWFLSHITIVLAMSRVLSSTVPSSFPFLIFSKFCRMVSSSSESISTWRFFNFFLFDSGHPWQRSSWYVVLHVQFSQN